MRRAAWCRTLAAIAAVTLVLPATATAPPKKEKTGSLTQVGHEPLMSRGMNAAMAIHGDYAYIGSRTDGGHEGMPHGGVMVVDISDPTEPTLLGPPFDAKPGESSRELRVWRSQDILIVLNTNCGVGDTLHHCTQPSISNFRFYDISGANATHPQLLNQFNADTHEFFLWEDPRNPERALVFAGNASSTCGIRGGSPSCPFAVWDISPVRNGQPPVTLFSGLHGYTRFPAAPPLTFGALDMNRPFEEQGVPAGSVTVVYAVNTLHVAHDLAFTLAEIFRALAPGGQLIASECVRPWPGQPVYAEFIFNLMATFRAPRLHLPWRPNGGFLTADQWTAAVEAAGFTSVRLLPDALELRKHFSNIYVAAVGATRL